MSATLSVLTMQSYSRRENWCSRTPTPDQLRALGIYFSQSFDLTRDQRLAALGKIFGREIVSTKDLTRGEISTLLELQHNPNWSEPLHTLILENLPQIANKETV